MISTLSSHKEALTTPAAHQAAWPNSTDLFTLPCPCTGSLAAQRLGNLPRPASLTVVALPCPASMRVAGLHEPALPLKAPYNMLTLGLSDHALLLVTC